MSQPPASPNATQSYKLALPLVAGQVPRHGAMATLARCLQDTPLTWMVGLPGAGKTSLAAHCMRQAGAVPCLWYRLDEDDADIACVFNGLRQHPRRHDAAADLPAWSPDNQPDLPGFARRFFAQLASGGPLTLVFDDCHRVADDSAFFRMIDAARELAGSGLQLLLISRRPPPPLLERGSVAGWLAVYDDLALTPDEAAAIARGASGRDWSEAELQRLQPAQGWMAHVLALARTAPSDALLPRAAGRVGDFLANELLLSLPAAQRRPLRLLAELPELPRALAGTATLPAPLARFLEGLHERRYFVEATEAGAWRLHDLLRDGLRAQNTLLEDAPSLAAARRELAAAVTELAPEAAMGLLVSASDDAAVEALLERQGRRWLSQGRHRQLIAWLDGLDTPGLLAWRAEALLPLEPEAARPLFAQSREARTAAGDADGAYRAWCGEVASYVVQWGAVQGLAERVDDLEALEAQLGPAPGDWHFRVAADALTALMYGRAEDPRIDRYAKATAHAVEHAPDAGSRIAAAAQLLIYRLWWAGDFPGGRALYNAFDAEVDAGVGLAPLPRLLWWSNAAIVDWQCGDPARCYDKVDRGLALAESSGVHVRDFFLLTQGIFCALSQEDWPRAESYLARLAQTERDHKRLDVMVHHFFRSWYCLCRGDARTALAHAETAMPMAQALGSLFHKVIVLSVLAPSRLHSGDMAGAAAAYQEQLALAKLSHNPTFSYIAFCSGAEIALVAGDALALHKQVERILMVKQLGGFHSDCGWRTPVRAKLLAFALDQRLLPEVARQWILEKHVPPPKGYRGEWPMPVQISALAGLSVTVDGRAVDTSTGAKPTTRLRELLAVLVVRRQGATQAELCDWLWPDAEGDKAAASLKVGVHRLRGWLGHDAVHVRNGIVALNLLRVACDLWWQEDHEPQQLAQIATQVLAGCNAPPVAQLRQRLVGDHRA